MKQAPLEHTTAPLCVSWGCLHPTAEGSSACPRTTRLVELKIFAIWPFAEKFADLCCRAAIVFADSVQKLSYLKYCTLIHT